MKSPLVTRSTPRVLCVHRLGRVEYEDGLRLMALAGEEVRDKGPPDCDHLFVLEHPPVLTLGRGASASNVLASPEWLAQRGFSLHRTDRGGDVTYHGPGQIVAYPVLDLTDRPDVRRYVHALEEAMILTCRDFDVVAGRHEVHRGAWVGSKKIGAVGVHFSRWITSHGLAFNAAPDLRHFQAIVPCGISDPRLGVTSLAAELEARGRTRPELSLVEDRLATHLAATLGREPEERAPALETVSVVPIGADGRVLLLKRTEERGGFWQPVTGRIEPGEAPAAAARRELQEETGAEVAVAPLGYRHGFAVEPRLLSREMPRLTVVREEAFKAVLPADFACRLSAEHVEQGWFSPARALELLPFPGLRRALRLATDE